MLNKPKKIQKILILLVTHGYVTSFTLIDKKRIIIYLKYTTTGDTLIRSLLGVSKPGERVFLNNKNLKKINRLTNLNGAYQLLIVSTPKGVLTQEKALYYNVGGEPLLIIN